MLRYFILSAGFHPPQDITGRRGYFGNRASLSESPQRKKVDPLSDVIALAWMQLAQRPAGTAVLKVCPAPPRRT